MGTKKTIILSDDAMDYISARCKEGNEISWSGSVNMSLELLDWLAVEQLPEFTEEEWKLILTTYAGCITDYHRPLRVASDMMDNFGEVDINELKPEIAATIKKVAALSQAQQFAVLDFVNVFWSSNFNKAKDWDDIYNRIIKRDFAF